MTFRMRRFCVLLVGLFGLVGSLGTSNAQTIVVTAKSSAELSDDLEYLIKTVVPKDNPIVQVALDALGQVKSGAVLKGLDRSRGFGLAVTLPRNFGAGEPPSIVAAVPVSDLGQFLESLNVLGLAVDDQPGVAGFSHKVTAPNGNPPLFVVQSKGYAFFSVVPDGADRIKAMDPTSWKPKRRAETAVSAKIRLSEVTDAFKDQVLNQLEANINQQNEREPGEKDNEFMARLVGQKASLDAFKSLIRDGDEIALDFDLSRKTSELALELAISARPNTTLAKALLALRGRRSLFQGLSKDAVIGAWASLPVATELRNGLSDSFDQAVKAGLKGVDSEEDKKLITRLAELTKSSLYAPEIDLGFALQEKSPVAQGAPNFVMLAGMKVKNGREFERLVRAAAAKNGFVKDFNINFDVAKAADGTAIHRLSASNGEEGAEVAKRFGKTSLFFAIRDAAVLASFGESGLAPLQRSIERFSGPHVAGSDEPVSAVIHAADFAGFAAKNEDEVRRASADVFRGEDAKRDRVHLGLTEANGGIRIRLAVDVPALKLFAVLGKQVQH
jgi:hypothetical protein